MGLVFWQLCTPAVLWTLDYSLLKSYANDSTSTFCKQAQGSNATPKYMINDVSFSEDPITNDSPHGTNDIIYHYSDPDLNSPFQSCNFPKIWHEQNYPLVFSPQNSLQF